jgi:hypothetical protein
MKMNEALEAGFQRLMNHKNVRALDRNRDLYRDDCYIIVFTPNRERRIDLLNQRGHYSIECIPADDCARGGTSAYDRAHGYLNIGLYYFESLEYALDLLTSFPQWNMMKYEIIVYRDETK